MPGARFPASDPSRLAALHALQILDTEREAAFDDFTQLASALFDTPMAAISLVDTNRQWYKSSVGLTMQETPRDLAFCGYTILGAEPLVIEDAKLDERVYDNELVTGGPRFRFYAGVSLKTAEGHNIGALCTMDTRPRVVTRSQIAALEDLGGRVMKAIEQRGEPHRAAVRLKGSQTRRDRGPLASEAATARGALPLALAAEPGSTVAGIAAAAVQPSRTESQLALDAMSQGVCMFDAEGLLTLCNDRYADLYRLPPALMRPGTPLRDIVDRRYAQGSFPNLSREEYLQWREQVALSPVMSETEVELRDGRTIAVRHHPLPGGGYVATHDDITLRRMAEARVVHMARHDGLTDLPNRMSFNERLTQEISQAARGKSFAVLCLDLDGFKCVNDTFGHGMGDKLLIAVGQRLRSCIREVDLLARLGGDEFAIIQHNSESVVEITATCERILTAISHPFLIDGCRIIVGVSIGITVAPADGMDCDGLLRSADLALYLAKLEGKGTFRFFEPEIDARAQLRRSLEADLRESLGSGEFEVHYQPLVNLASQQVSSVEALLRWNHPTRGMVPPTEFIPLAEEVGLIFAIGEFVLRRACMDAVGWPDNVRLAVNISPVQFRCGHLFKLVEEALHESGLPPGRLELEITETVLMTRSESNLDVLRRLRSLGVRIALDDFGTGYSSLSYLKSFPFDKIKIDQSFVRDLSNRRDLACIVGAVASMGVGLGMCTTAEGVETVAELDRLVQEGCTEAQGFLFSAARPAADIPSLLLQINDRAFRAANLQKAA